MENTKNPLNAWEAAIVCIALGVVSAIIGNFIKIKVDLLTNKLLNFYNSFEVFPFENSLYFKITIISLFVIIIILAFYKMSIAIHGKIQAAKEEIRKTVKKKEEGINLLKSIVSTRTDFMKSEQLRELLSKLRKSENLMDEPYAEEYEDALKEKWEECTRRMEIEEHKERVLELKREEDERIKRIEEYEKIEKEKQKKLEERKENILNRLEIFDNYVFKRDELSNQEIEVLKDNGYSPENEFCVFEKKRINVLVKPPVNHSVHHTFLVWSAIRLLEKNRKVSHVNERLTVDADIVFKFEDKIFAIEVETGSLLRKKDQLKEKIGYLKRKYSDRWIFLVSNKELFSKYSKFGLTATRKDMARKLEKLLENSQK